MLLVVTVILNRCFLQQILKQRNFYVCERSENLYSCRDFNFGHLYTISKPATDTLEERTYDEPYAGDLPRRSWLCCPGSHQHAETEQPPLLFGETSANKSPTTQSETITKPPKIGYEGCTGTCVCIRYFLLLFYHINSSLIESEIIFKFIMYIKITGNFFCKIRL